MLRLRLTPRDLGNIRIADAPAPVLDLSQHAQAGGILVGSRAARDEAARRGLDVDDLLLAGNLFGTACSPGFLHPDVTDARSAVDLIADTPRSTVLQDLNETAALGYPKPAWTLDLARPGVDGARLRRQVSSALTRLLERVIEPSVGEAEPLAARRRLHLAEIHRTHGPRALLNSLDGSIRYRPPFLEVDLASGVDVTTSSGGNGLTLIPSLVPIPSVRVSSTGRPTLVTFSLAPPPLEASTLADMSVHPLGKLIGQSRAQLLVRLAARPGVGTRELARQSAMSPATVSGHLTILRATGLIDTVALWGRQSHHVTPLGHDVLRHRR